MTGKDQKQDRPIEDLVAADEFRRKLLAQADANQGGAPLWHGWALFDAFLAGLDHARVSLKPMRHMTKDEQRSMHEGLRRSVKIIHQGVGGSTMAVGTATENKIRNELFDAFMGVAQANKATGDDASVALITLVAVHVAHNLKSEPQQDAYLNWFVAGVEGVLKASGVRTTARPNPLAPSSLRVAS